MTGALGVQDAWDFTAIASSIVAGSYIYARRQMLSGLFKTWHTAAGFVQFLLALQAMWMGYVAVIIGFGGAHVSPRETVTYVISAAVSFGLQRNLERHGRRSSPPPHSEPAR